MIYKKFDSCCYDILVAFKEYEIAGVPGGTLFNLGKEYEMELIFLPGHSSGHAAFLDKKSRILFAGDDACFGALGIGGGREGNPYKKNATVEALYIELQKLTARMDEFDGIFPGHGPVDLGPIMLVNVMEACQAVLADPTCYHQKSETEIDGTKTTQYRRMIYQSGYLRYNSGSLYMDKTLDAGI